MSHRDPTAEKAIGRASRTRRDTLPAGRDQLEQRLHAAIERRDGAGLRLITARIARSG